MRVAAKGCVLHGAEGATPPLPWVTVDRKEGHELIRKGLAVAVEGGEDDAGDDMDIAYVLNAEPNDNDFAVLDMIAADKAYEPWFTAYVASRLPDILAKHAPAAAADSAPRPARKAKAKADAPADTPPADPAPADAERAQHIADALDLVEDEHLETEGDRAGKPKLSAIAEITGFDVTAEEVDAALALKEVAA